MQSPDDDRRPGRAHLRRLLRLARPELGKLALGTLFLGVGSGISLLLPQAIRKIVDDALGPGSGVEAIDDAALWLALLIVVQAAAVALRYVLFSTAGERVVARLRAQLFEHLLRQEVAFFDDHRTGELTNRLASDATVLQSAVSVNVSMALRYAASVIGGVAFLFYTSPRLTLLMLAVVPVVALGSVAYGRRVRRLSRSVQDALARASEVAEEALSGIRTVRAFAAEQHEAARYSGRVAESFDLARKRIRASGSFMGVVTFAGYSAAALVLWYGGHLVVEGRMTLGGLTSFLVYTIVVAFALGGLSDLWADFMKATGAAERIFDLLDREPAMADAGGAQPSAVEGRLELRRVRFSYPTRKDVPVLKGIDIAVRPGEVIALVGPSGAGKSTIASLLLRLYDPDEGRILLDGRDLRELSPTWLRRQVGIVAQEPLLFAASVADNIRYGREGASDAEIEAAARAANAHGFIQRFPSGYRTLVGERGVQLSGGQKQRVAIARAMLKDPRLLVLDEATSALDAESEHLVKGALDALMKGRTTLIIAHRLSTVMGADRVLVMDGGTIVQSGAHAALIAEDGLYRRLVERQFVSAQLTTTAV
ncbi:MULTISPECIES: ABC transporter ATP-binding protein [Sorangium]|uniref:ABC transporter permease n=1 Tax=Sorangium cellulosum TaxID=56 RepID=A0A4P2QKV4_SORCE|nr:MULTISPECIES: ABC transporter transmembrane domain-containing protein [Sorangium]AUX30341.1 ABC transporter permease [Sorangium cellulosum]WCQ89735.1 Lipid A export ATP-binding/permease protein MsbA [Sorangium sp. Soce836]